MPLTNYAFDNAISQHLSKLTECNAPEVSSRFPEKSFWVSNFSLNSIFGGKFSKEGRTFVFFFLRRAEAAFTEYEYACQMLKEFVGKTSISPSLYFKTLHHFEIVISMMWQAYMLTMKVTKGIYFIPGDGSKYERLNWIYNKSRHFDPSELSAENIHVTWLTNNGVQTEKFEVTYSEIESFLNEIGNMANEFSKAGK